MKESINSFSSGQQNKVNGNIQSSIPSKTFVNIEVYDIIGNKIATLVNGEKTSGNFTVRFDGSDLSSGIYYYRIKADKFLKTGKMILLK